MAQTDAQLEQVAREIVSRIFVAANATAHSSHAQIKAAIQAIDTGMDATLNQAVTQSGGTTKVKIAFLNQAKAGAPNLTNQQAAVAMAMWALKEAGLI